MFALHAVGAGAGVGAGRLGWMTSGGPVSVACGTGGCCCLPARIAAYIACCCGFRGGAAVAGATVASGEMLLSTLLALACSGSLSCGAE